MSTRADILTATGLCVFVTSAYFATASGITSSNDGSHYALLRSMVDEGKFEISSYAQFAEGNDLARVGEKIYSDRPPGTALLAIPFYLLGNVLPAPLTPLPSRHDADNPRLLYLMLVPVFSGAGAVALLYWIGRGFDLSRFSAVTASLAFAFGSLNWKYGSVLFSHAQSALLVMLGVFLALRIARETSRDSSDRPSLWLRFAAGLVLGCSVLVEYSNVVFATLTLAYLTAATLWERTRRVEASAGALRQKARLAAPGALLFGLALPLALLAYYNAVNFGGPLTTSYAYAANYPWAARFSTTFDYPVLDGLKAMLWYSDDPRFLGNVNQGLWLLMPVTFVSLFGLRPLWKASRRDFIFVAGLFVVYLLLFSKHHTLHGFTGDGRYLAPFLGLWFVPLGFWVEQHLFRPDGDVRRALYAVAFYGALFLSGRNLFVHIGDSYNYRLDLTQWAPVSAAPMNWAYALGTVFPNLGNLPLLWLTEALLAAILALSWWATTELTHRRRGG